jgi:hypothetical protein
MIPARWPALDITPENEKRHPAGIHGGGRSVGVIAAASCSWFYRAARLMAGGILLFGSVNPRSCAIALLYQRNETHS